MIYFIRKDNKRGLIKIGTSVCLRSRKVQIEAVHGPVSVLAVMPGSFADEKALHDRFEEIRQEGEWFLPTGELLDFIGAEGRVWDGKDERQRGRLVRLDDDLCDKAQKLAALRGQSMAEMFVDWLRPIVDREWAKEVRKLKEDGP